MRFLLVSERSGGHVYPAFVIAEKIKEKDPKINKIFFFTTSAFFQKLIKNKGYITLGVVFKFRNILIELFLRFIESIYILIKVRPDYVLGFGGRDSIFLVLFSRFFTNNVYIYEPNTKMGRANKFLAPFIKKILRGIPPQDQNKNYKLIGIPLKKDIIKADKKIIKKRLGFNEKPVILCFGGSQGSSFVNDIFFNFIQTDNNQSYQIIHITGKNDYWRMVELYKKINNNKIIKNFQADMAIFYNLADVVISRAGALTLGEICFYSIPSILIPHPGALGHQKMNADYLKEKKMAFVFEQHNFDYNKFKDCLSSLILNKTIRENMKNNISKMKIGVSYQNFYLDFID